VGRCRRAVLDARLGGSTWGRPGACLQPTQRRASPRVRHGPAQQRRPAPSRSPPKTRMNTCTQQGRKPPRVRGRARPQPHPPTAKKQAPSASSPPPTPPDFWLNHATNPTSTPPPRPHRQPPPTHTAPSRAQESLGEAGGRPDDLLPAPQRGHDWRPLEPLVRALVFGLPVERAGRVDQALTHALAPRPELDRHDREDPVCLFMGEADDGPPTLAQQPDQPTGGPT
jgi:hypothetical protein